MPTRLFLAHSLACIERVQLLLLLSCIALVIVRLLRLFASLQLLVPHDHLLGRRVNLVNALGRHLLMHCVRRGYRRGVLLKFGLETEIFLIFQSWSI